LRFGRGKIAALREAVYDRFMAHEAADELPTSIRFIYYELVQHNPAVLAQFTGQQTPSQITATAAMWLREEGLVPWEWVIDEGRSVTAYTYAKSVAEYVKDSVDDASIDRWGGNPPPLIICEAATFGGVVERAFAADYRCAVTATKGQAGGYLHTDVMPYVRDGRRVLYVGDYNIAGGHIEENTRRVLEAEVGPLNWKRVAMLPDQAAGLPTVIKKDNRYRPPRRYKSVEVEALGQGKVLGLLRAELDALLPEPLDRVRVREERERKRVRAALKKLR
jgi:hypothetical protein